MPVHDELERKRQKAVLFWLTLLWLAAMAYFVTNYYTVDLHGSRHKANWEAIRYLCLISTAVYAALLGAALWRWPAGRLALLIVSLAGTVFLGFLAIAFGLLFVWIWNLQQYLCLLFGTFAVFRVFRLTQHRNPETKSFLRRV